LLPHSKFCSQCGRSVAPQIFQAEQPETTVQPRVALAKAPSGGATSTNPDAQGERREVTVLFLDLMDYTRFSKQIDSEETYLIVDEAMRLLVQIIYRYEGTVDKFTGDGLMALFGTPVAHENDPERAVHAALEMQQILKPLQKRIFEKYGFDFQARIGINTGLVIAGNLGNDLHKEYTVIGDTVNLASRLEGAAKAGTVLVSASTYQQTHPIFSYQTLPPQQLKGIAEPVVAYRPLAMRRHPDSVRGLPGMETPMIGRIDELATLHKTWASVQKERRNQLVLVTGEAGLGKSRLVAEFRRELEQRTSNIYQGNCLAFARSKPFWVFASLLRDILLISELDSVEHQSETLRLFIDGLDLPAQQVLPYLNSILGLDQAESGIGHSLQQLDPSMVQRQTYVVMRQVLLAMAQSAPLILILEDLHWLDPASKELLIYLMGAISEAPILLVLISREFERKTTIRPLLDILEKSPQRFVDVRLKRLSEAEALQLLTQLLKGTDEEGPLYQLQQRIVKRAEGNPFYIEEIVRMLIDQQVLIQYNNHFALTTRPEESLDQLPGTLKSLILTRFDGLDEELRQILQKAAVLGRSFPLSLLQALSPANPEATVTYLYELKNRLFLAEDPFNREPGFTFYHALIQEAIYDMILKRDRRTLHGQVGQVIEWGQFYNEDERVEALGYHYAHSSEPFKAIPYLIAAADNAGRRSAHETAIEHYRRALMLMAEQSEPDGDDYSRVRMGLGYTLKLKGEFTEAGQRLTEAIEWLSRPAHESPTQQVKLVEALRELADVRQRAGALDEAVEHLETALSLIDKLGPQRDSLLWFAIIDRMAWVRFRLGQLDEAAHFATGAVHSLEEQQPNAFALLASLYNTLGGTYYQQGNPSEAIPFVQNSLRLHDMVGYTWGRAVAHINLGVLYYVQGIWSTAVEHYRQADVIERENGFVAERAVNLRNLGLLHIGMGNHKQAHQDYETSLAISKHIGDSTGIGCCQIGLAHLAFIQSRLEDAKRHIHEAQEQAESLGEDHFLHLLLIQARIHAETGEFQPGFELASQVLQMAQASGLSEEEVDAYRILGILHTRSADYDRSERLLRQSLELAQQRRNPYQQGVALFELGRLYELQSREHSLHRDKFLQKAEEVLIGAIDAFEQLGAAYDLQMAQLLLQQIRDLSLFAMPPATSSCIRV
jgi:class 3 adenylate cyclase/tetratricopeptide (TPR) repeat protein